MLKQVDELLLRVDAELGVDVGDVGLGGVARDAELFLQVVGVAPAGKQVKHLALAAGETGCLGKAGNAFLDGRQRRDRRCTRSA